MTTEEKMLAKKRGRPATGRGQTIGVRIHESELVAIDQAIASEPPPPPSRPEMIRRLVAEGLEGRSRAKRSSGVKDPAATARTSAKARAHAVTKADAEMAGLDATAETKTARRKTLTEKPAMVAKARGKVKG